MYIAIIFAGVTIIYSIIVIYFIDKVIRLKSYNKIIQRCLDYELSEVQALLVKLAESKAELYKSRKKESNV